MIERHANDTNGDPVYLRDVYHDHDPDLRTPTEMWPGHDPNACDNCSIGQPCWVSLIPGGGGCVNGCHNVAVEGGLCIACCEKRDRRDEWWAS